MVLDCWVIILILGIAAYMFVRSDKKAWAPGVLPLMVVPLLTIIVYLPTKHIAVVDLNPVKANLIRLIVYTVSFLAASFWVVAFARRLPKGRSKYAYIISSILFTVILIIIFIFKFKYFYL
jgi:hypothetical protein